LGYSFIVNNFLVLMVPLALTVGTYAGAWWYVVIHNAPAAATAVATAPAQPDKPVELSAAAEQTPDRGSVEEKLKELGSAETTVESPEPTQPVDAPPRELTSLAEPTAAATNKVPAQFYTWFWGLAAFSTLLLIYYYRRMDGEQFEILKELTISVVPLGVLTFVVLAVILLGICTATESAAVGALGALYLAVMAKYPRQVWWWSVVGAIIGVSLGWWQGEDFASLIVSGSLGGTFLGTVVPGLWNLKTSPELRQNMKGATFLTAKTTAMVCWLFIGSALFSAVFALHGGQGLIERWVLGMNLSPLGF